MEDKSATPSSSFPTPQAHLHLSHSILPHASEGSAPSGPKPQTKRGKKLYSLGMGDGGKRGDAEDGGWYGSIPGICNDIGNDDHGADNDPDNNNIDDDSDDHNGDAQDLPWR